jgi:diadenosine tetraphosphate (Ap4A) HIT family hydrolase
MSSKETCPFCNLDEHILLENTLAAAFLSDPRKVKGHMLVIPKRHVEKPWELTPEEVQAVFDLIFQIEKKGEGKLGTGFDIRQNYRPFLEETRLKVDHALFHVIPRRKLDHIYEVAERFDTVLFEKLTDQERADVEGLFDDSK